MGLNHRLPEYEREPILQWLREVCPDLRILKGHVNGARVCAARFTYAGQLHEYACTQNADMPDPDDGIVRTCYVALAKVMGFPTAYDRRRGLEHEQAVLEASLRGDTESADRIGRELVVGNAGVAAQRARWRTTFGRRTS